MKSKALNQVEECKCTCHTNPYFDEPHLKSCKKDGTNPYHPYTHPKPKPSIKK